jgi:hypothetical protein
MEGWKIGRMEDWEWKDGRLRGNPNPLFQSFAFHTALKIY